MFAIHAKNSETGKVFTYKSRITKQTTTFYAERGLIRIHDEADGSYKVESLSEFLARAKAIYRGILRTEPSDERADQIRLVQTMKLAIEAAQEQGDPLSLKRRMEMMRPKRGARMVNPGLLLPGLPQAPADKPPVPLDSVRPEPVRKTVVARSTNILGV